MVAYKAPTKVSPDKYLDYIKNCEKGYPKRLYWKVIAGPPLTFAQQQDLIFDERDYKIRGITPPKPVAEEIPRS